MTNAGEFLFGSKDKIKTASTLTGTQKDLEKLIQEALTKGTGPLADIFGGFNEEEFEKGVTQPALKNFKESILPQLQEKFIANNSVLGSGYRRAKFKAGTDLQSKLAELLYQAQQGQKQNKIAGVGTLYGKQGVENIYRQGTTGAVQGFIQGVGEGAGKAFGGKIAG